jgi:hypothetical protein
MVKKIKSARISALSLVGQFPDGEEYAPRNRQSVALMIKAKEADPVYSAGVLAAVAANTVAPRPTLADLEAARLERCGTDSYAVANSPLSVEDAFKAGRKARAVAAERNEG